MHEEPKIKTPVTLSRLLFRQELLGYLGFYVHRMSHLELNKRLEIDDEEDTFVSLFCRVPSGKIVEVESAARYGCLCDGCAAYLSSAAEVMNKKLQDVHGLTFAADVEWEVLPLTRVHYSDYSELDS